MTKALLETLWGQRPLTPLGEAPMCRNAGDRRRLRIAGQQLTIPTVQAVPVQILARRDA